MYKIYFTDPTEITCYMFMYTFMNIHVHIYTCASMLMCPLVKATPTTEGRRKII